MNLPSQEPPEAEQYCFIAVQSCSHLTKKDMSQAFSKEFFDESKTVKKHLLDIFVEK